MTHAEAGTIEEKERESLISGFRLFSVLYFQYFYGWTLRQCPVWPGFQILTLQSISSSIIGDYKRRAQHKCSRWLKSTSSTLEGCDAVTTQVVVLFLKVLQNSKKYRLLSAVFFFSFCLHRPSDTLSLQHCSWWWWWWWCCCDVLKLILSVWLFVFGCFLVEDGDWLID